MSEGCAHAWAEALDPELASQHVAEGNAGATEQTQEPALLTLRLKTPQMPREPEILCMGCCLPMVPTDVATAESITRKTKNLSCLPIFQFLTPVSIDMGTLSM